jgi:hypothetical protein
MREDSAALLRSAGLWRALLHRSRSDWPVVVAAGALLLCATVLLAAGAVYGDVVALGGVRQAILDAPPADRAVVVTSTATSADVGAFDDIVTRQAIEVLGAGGGEVGFVIRSGAFEPTAATDDSAGLTRLASYRAIEDHAEIVDGRWPTPGRDPFEAVLSEGASVALGAAVGDELSIASRDGAAPVEIEIVGVWRPDRTDPYWIADILELDGVEERGPFVTSGPIVIDREDLVRRIALRELELEWRVIPAVEGFRVDRLAELRADIETLDERLRDARLPGRSLRVTSALPGILSDLERATLVSRSGVMLLTIQFAILAAYAIILVAGMLIERRRIEAALLRSRGASTLHLTAMAFGEAVMLAIPAAIIGPWAAVGVVQLLGATGPLASTGIAATASVDPGVMVVAGVAAAACVLALTVPSLFSGGNPAGVRAQISRQMGRTLAQRLGIDIVLVILAGIGLWQLRLYGSPLTANARGALGFDPLLVAAPGVGLLAGGIVATRLVPRIAEVAERVLSRRRGLVAAIGARQVARRPLRYTRSALLLMLAAALGTFAASDSATWTQSQQDQATYQAAADARVVLSDYSDLPTWAVGPALRSIEGVTAAAPISRSPIAVGRAVREGQLLALDPASAPGLVNYHTIEDAARLPAILATLGDERPATQTVEISPDPRRLAIVIDAAIEPDVEANPEAIIPPDFQGIETAVILEDGDGRLHRVAGSSGVLVGTGQRLEVPLTEAVDGVEVAFPPPVRLQAVIITLFAPPDVIALGTVDIVAVEASEDAAGSSWFPVPWRPNAPGWNWESFRGGDDRRFAPPPGSPNRILLGYEPGNAEPLFGGGGSAVFRSATLPADAERLPAVVSDEFLEQSGARVGEALAVTASGQRLTLHILASTPTFPSLDPAQPFVIVDATTLERARQAVTGQLVPTREWWLGLDSAASPETVEATLRGAPIAAAEVVGRESLTRSLSADPISLGIIGALGLGALAALAFASIGFIVSATVSTSERITEFAILRALGLSVRELSAWVSLEHAFLLLFGMIAGSALGLFLAWLVLPFATLTSSGAAAVPPPEVVIPWTAMAPLYLVAALLFVATVVLVTRQVGRAGISTVLRSGEE